MWSVLGARPARAQVIEQMAARVQSRLLSASTGAHLLTAAVEALQARAHVLLKAKEAELRVARETGAASEAHQAELAAAKAALADAQAAVDAVRAPANFLQ